MLHLPYSWIIRINFYYLPRTVLADKIDPQIRKYVRYLMIVTSPDNSGLIMLTAYKHPQAVKHVKKKSKIYWTQA